MTTTTTGTRLKQLMAEKGLRQVDILNKTKIFQKKYNIKVRKNDLSQYVNDKVTPRQDKLFILALALDVDEAWLSGYDVPKERNPKNYSASALTNVNEIYKRLDFPRQDKVFHYAKFQLEDQNFMLQEQGSTYEKEYSINTTSVNSSELPYDEHVDTIVPVNADRAFVVKGDSMLPEYEDGDIAFYHLQSDVENGDIAVVEVDGRVTYKKVIKREQKMFLQPLNDKFPEREVSSEGIRILGKIVK